MKSKTFKAFLGAFLLSVTMIGANMVQAATVYPPEGGQWNYGVGILGSYSDYLHGQRTHGSTVNHNGSRYSSTAPAGSWSQALAQGVYSGCSFYYNL